MYILSLHKDNVFKGENKVSVQHFPNYGTIEFELALNDINHLVLLLYYTATFVLANATKLQKQNNEKSSLLAETSHTLYKAYQKHPYHLYGALTNPLPTQLTSHHLYPCENHYVHGSGCGLPRAPR